MTHEREPLRIVYILGTGHSGSTLLELILSTAPGTFSVGGFRYLDRYVHRTHGVEVDDQGHRAEESPMWAPFAKDRDTYILKQPVEPTLSFRNRLHILFTGRALIVPHRYRNARLFHDVRDRASDLLGHDVHTIITSSKTLARFIEVRERADADVFVIHLIRDVRGVVNSNRKLGKPILASAKYWLTDNLYAASYLRTSVPKDRQMKLTYEAFVADPEAHIARINAFTGFDIDPGSIVERINEQSSYRFAGNAMRNRTFTGIRKDVSWRKQLPALWRVFLKPLNIVTKIITD